MRTWPTPLTQLGGSQLPSGSQGDWRRARRRGGSAAAHALHELAQVDLAVYRAIAGTPTPTIDEPLRRLSGLANHSKLWVGVAGALFAFGGGPVAGGRDGPGRDRRQLGRGEPADEVRERTRPSGSRGCGRAGGAAGADAHLHVLPLGPLASGFAFAGRWPGRCLGSRSRSAGSPPPSPTRACIRACTIRRRGWSARSSEPRSGRRRRSQNVPAPTPRAALALELTDIVYTARDRFPPAFGGDPSSATTMDEPGS